MHVSIYCNCILKVLLCHTLEREVQQLLSCRKSPNARYLVWVLRINWSHKYTKRRGKILYLHEYMVLKIISLLGFCVNQYFKACLLDLRDCSGWIKADSNILPWLALFELYMVALKYAWQQTSLCFTKENRRKLETS